MRKLFLVGALALGSLSVMANGSALTSDEVIVTVAQDDFTEISTSELPTAVTDAVATSYPTATITKAHVNSEKQYKLEVALEDGTTGTLYADEDGNWLDL
ncbi:hypothetical protein ACFQZJ_16075 [Maribacter chungangensis]|uniref:Beta-lactamase-inhibitor-like PepSY-like domain-containing protein n=1 Tax=Maribacter chungangensis TaxID=1069117 RepID=A0ABW3B806_9FLAO